MPDGDVVLTIRASTGPSAFARSRQYAAAWREGANVPRRWTAITASHSAGSMLTSIRSRRIPALLTSTSRRPNASIARATIAPASSKSATLPPSTTASPPAATISSTTDWAGERSAPSPPTSPPRSLTTTFAPWPASNSACSRPMPRPAPVTRATRPSHSRDIKKSSFAEIGAHHREPRPSTLAACGGTGDRGGTAGARLWAGTAEAKTTACAHWPILVLSAMPLELNPLAARAKLDLARAVRIDDRTFYRGRLAGRDVVLAVTGVGPVNATQTVSVALARFRCGFSAAVFSGVAGSRLNIGGVAAPRRWTADGGKTWTRADPSLLAVANRLAVSLSADVPVGDAACLCPGVDAATPAHVDHAPKIAVGGDGATTDP